MADLNDTDRQERAQITLSQRDLSQSEDESLVESSLDMGDDDPLFDIQDEDDDDLGSSSEVESSPAEQPTSFANSFRDKQTKVESVLSNEIKVESTGDSTELSQSQSKRSSGRLRKEKVPAPRKNLFPGRPRITNRGRKFNLNLSETVASSSSSVSFKSPSTAIISETIELESKPSMELLSTDDGNSSELVSSVQSTPETSSDAINLHSFASTDDLSINNEKLTSVKKKISHPGKIKGKLSGGRKKAKIVEYRRRRGTKGKFKNFSSAIAITSLQSTSGTNPSNEADKQDDANENKIILCSSKDLFMLTQDLCVMCGSIGKDEEGRLLSCSQCGQCYHPFCAGVTKITKIMLKKGWRCLECTVCEGCGKPTDESRLLLCDDCDISYHTYCLDPPLENVPQGTWKCQWCVVCVKCNATTPGYRSHWQANYTLCGPCASQENCSRCKECYRENDLVIQCVQCNRWLHAKCDSMIDEDECEIASCIGYNCFNCRPSDELPAHIQARKNGTLGSILNKKRSEEKIELTSNKRVEQTNGREFSDISVEPTPLPLTSTVTETVVPTNAATKPTKFHMIDGVYLTDHGAAMMKSLTMEQPKKTRVKRKMGKEEQSQPEPQNKELDESLDDKSFDPEMLAKQNEEEKKMRQRRLRLEKLGIGGFSVKQRSRFSMNREDEELSQENVERSGTPDGSDKPKRRRRINKKKSQLQELFPSYMQEAFFGQDLLASIQSGASASHLHLSDVESEEEDFDFKSLGKDKIIDISSIDINDGKGKSDDINFLDENFQESLDDLQTAEDFEGLQLSPDDMIMDMFINEDLDRNDEVLDELTNSNKIEGDVKDDMDILDGNFNFNDLDDNGLPQMDCKDVEDLFNEVMSDSSIQHPKDYQMAQGSNSHVQMLPKPIVEPLQLSSMMQPKVEMPSSHPSISNVSTPITPMSADPLGLNHKPFSTFENSPPMADINVNQFRPMNSKSSDSWPNSETDGEISTQSSKNYFKWEMEEALGPIATISPVLYCNLNCPNLKLEYPLWGDRLKQITKIWRQLSTDQRQPFLQKARENRAANRVQKTEFGSKGKELKSESDSRAAPCTQGSLQSAAMINADSNLAPSQMPNQPNEMPYPMSDYGPQPVNQMYSPSQMPMHPQVKPSTQILLNRPAHTPGPSALHSPMSPMLNSPRLRPGMQSPFPDGFAQQPPQSHQMNMVRPSSVVSQGSFSPSSPSLNQNVHSNECYPTSNPSTPQRPQSTDPQHSYNQATSPYGVPPRTPSNMLNPFSPSQHHPHQQMPMHASAVSNDNFSIASHQTTPQSGMESPQNSDMYKVSMTPQHQISKPHTPDSFVPSMSSSLPSTPQPPSSPQIPTPSPLNDIYARSPATPRSAPINQQVRPSFEDTFNQRQVQTDLFSPANTSGNYQQSYMQPNAYNIADSYANSPGVPKVQMRPNMNPNIRPNMPIRRAVSDPYARQPMTPMPISTADTPHSYGKPEENQNEQLAKQQQLRNLLQVNQMRRPESTTQSQPHSQPRPNWIDNGQPFRQPLSPAMNRNRMQNQFSMEQTLRYQSDQQRFMQRTEINRFRQMSPNVTQQPVRYPPQTMTQMQSPAQTQQQLSPIQNKPQQWPRTPMQPCPSTEMNSMVNQPSVPTQSIAQVTYPTSTNQTYQQPARNEMTEMNIPMQIKQEAKGLEGNTNKPPNELHVNSLGEDEGLPELGDDDDLLELGNDFNILEYGDPELADSALSGHSGKSNIFDELDEKDMLNEKEKDNDAKEKAKSEVKNEKMINRASFSQNEFISQNPSNKPNESEQPMARKGQGQGYSQNNDCLLSDDDFERLKMDFLNDPSESNNAIPPNQVNSLAQQPPPRPPMQVQSQHMNVPSHPPQQMSMPQQSQQAYHVQPQHNPQYSQVNPPNQPNQTMWQDQSFAKQANYPNRMHPRMPMNQPTALPPRHMPPGPPQQFYGPPNNRFVMHHSHPQAGHMQPNPIRTVPPQMSNIPPPPLPPPSEHMSEQDRQLKLQYEHWLIHKNNSIMEHQKYLEGDISKLRKMKKSLNAKQRQCRKNQNELSEQDSNELARITQELHGMQKTIEQGRKALRQHNLIIQEFKQKYGTSFNLPHSPAAQTIPPVQTSPRSVNSPLASLNTSGPGTPLGLGPSTPQSPSLTNPSPSSLVQNSPLSTLHSPASMLPPSPIHHSPMPNPEMSVSMRPQIVQDDNNPFSDVYLQKEKKQHVQQSAVYPHQMSTEMVESRQMYSGYSEDGSMQQYYQSQSQMSSYQMSPIRPPQSQMPHYPNMNEGNNFRFSTVQGISQQYGNQQQQPHGYQHIRRPPPPPYPGKPQHFNARPFQTSQQIRAAQLRPPQDHMPARMHGYNESGSMMSSDHYGMNQQMDHMSMSSMEPIVGEAQTTMEFKINELGPGHDNQSDPSSLQDTCEQPETSSNSNNNNNSINTVEPSCSVNPPITQNNQESVPLPSITIKNEIEDSASNSLNEETHTMLQTQTSNTVELLRESNQSHSNGDVMQDQSMQEVNGENFNEETSASRQEIRQNALLKQLLQNCPSADLNKVPTESATSSTSSLPSQLSSEKEIKFESNERSSCRHSDSTATIMTKNQPNLDLKTDSMPYESMDNEDSQPLTKENSPSNVPSAEKKMTYLDIRRAQLERDPTPPPEEPKPKRKRSTKRKESKSVDDSSESASNQSGTSSNTPKTTKKRVRKAAQHRTEDLANNNEQQEHLLQTILTHLRNLPNLPIIEPNLKVNQNICLPPDAPDLNTREPKLRGSFGNSVLSSTIDYYSTYPFGPNKTSSIVPPLPSAAQSNNSHNRQFYYDEFGYMKNIGDLKDHFKEPNMRNNMMSLYSRDTDSPDTVVSSSSPECMLYDMPSDEYNKMKFINDDFDFDEKDRASPPLFVPLPLRPTPIRPSMREHSEHDKENLHDNQKLKTSKSSSAYPLKETGNVNITLMLSSEHDVREVLLSLAKILKVTSSFNYDVEKSPSNKISSLLELNEKNNEQVYCQFCETLLNTQSGLLENEFRNFCDKECFDNFSVSGKLNDKLDIPFQSTNELQPESEEKEIIAILAGANDTTNAKPELDGIDPHVIQEKRWKNTRYLYWNGSLFKGERRNAEVEKSGDSIEEAYDKLEMCMKPKVDAVEKRVCIFCHEIGDGAINGPSRLLNMDVDRWVHLNCALWSTEVYEMLNGALMNVEVAYERAMSLTCVKCSQFGASLKCYRPRCNNIYHFPCAVKEKCMFFQDKSLLCPQHYPKSGQVTAEELTSLAVNRRVFINRDEQKQIARMIRNDQIGYCIMRIGSLIFLNIGQLLPHQLQNFHTNSYIYPIGYKISRFYWSFRRLGKRCLYICSIGEENGKPIFSVEIREDGYETVTYVESSAKAVWQKVLDPIIKMREESQTIKVFSDFISGEDLFGLTEPAIIRILESLPGVDTLYDYNFKYGRSPQYELPLAINPTGCARTEPKMRTHFKRPHTLHVSSNLSRSSLQSSLTTTESSIYVKQFVHSRISQYRKMKQEWRNNVYLARSRIQGLGLYAVRDIEKHTYIIEYIGLLIRNEIAERNERIHEAHNRGVYMFRLDDNTVIDATLCGGLARYVNHSCDPNCVAECVQIDRENKILIIANRRIQQGEELTYDYKFEVEDDQHKIPCHCGAVNCRKWMN